MLTYADVCRRMQVAKYIKQVYASNGCTVVVKLDEENIRSLQLKIDSSSILKAIVSDPKVKVKEKQIETNGPWKLTIRYTLYLFSWYKGANTDAKGLQLDRSTTAAAKTPSTTLSSSWRVQCGM